MEDDNDKDNGGERRVEFTVNFGGKLWTREDGI